MPSFRVLSIQGPHATLEDDHGHRATLPLAIFDAPPSVGSRFTLALAPLESGVPLPAAAARELLNELLRPSTP